MPTLPGLLSILWVATISFEFFRNTQSSEHWHFCTTSNGNKLAIVES